MSIFAAISLLLMLSTFVTQFFTSPESAAAVQQMSCYAYAWVVGFALSVCARDNICLRVPVLEEHLPEGGKTCCMAKCSVGELGKKTIPCVIIYILVSDVAFSMPWLFSAITAGAVIP